MSELIDALLDDAKERMRKSVEATHHEFDLSGPAARAPASWIGSSLTTTEPRPR